MSQLSPNLNKVNYLMDTRDYLRHLKLKPFAFDDNILFERINAWVGSN